MNAVVIHNLSRSATGLTRAERTIAAARQALSRMGAVSSRPQGEEEVHSAVLNLSLVVQAGEIFGVVGAHSAGKTTLLRLIAAELLPDAGTIHVFGLDTTKQASQVARLVTPVRLEGDLIDRLSAVDNLVYHARLMGSFAPETCLDGRKLLTMLGMDPQEMDQPLSTVSSVTRRKVALGRALQAQAQLVLLDDPFRELDPCDRLLAWQAVQRCNRETGRTILLATRQPADGLAICNRVALLEQGRLVAVGAPSELLHAEASPLEDCLALAV